MGGMQSVLCKQCRFQCKGQEHGSGGIIANELRPLGMNYTFMEVVAPQPWRFGDATPLFYIVAIIYLGG